MGCRHGARASRWSPLRLPRASAWPRPSRLRPPRRSPPVPTPVSWTTPLVVQPRRGVATVWVPCSRGVLLLAVWDGVRRNPDTPLSFGIGYKTSKVEKINAERRKKIEELEQDLQHSEDKHSELQRQAELKAEELAIVRGMWLPYWFASRSVLCQELASSKWHLHGKPTLEALT